LDTKLLEKNFKKANNQLFHIDGRKSKIKKEVYSLYDTYLTIIRSKLQNYLGEAINVLLNYSSNGIRVKDQNTILFIKNDLKKLVNKKLPFLTIEQLSIKKEHKFINNIKNNKEFKSNYSLESDVFSTKDFETIQSNNSTNYCNIYYQNLINEDNFKNINVDELILENRYFEDFKIDESLEFIKSTVLPEDCDEDKLSINIHESTDSNYFIPNEFKDILLWIDTLESSLNLYLQDLSIEINNELLKKNILKNFVKNDLLLYIFENHLLFSNPSPFILTFDPTSNQYFNCDEIYNDNKFSKINLININNAELEFININLSILKNKLLRIKSNIYLLIKKENYWFDKLKLNNNIKSALNKL
tara:strand:+ start:1351 stop:2427 length:1077 start_codon:yes stop_codon:yes gene_type:complete